MKYFQFQLLRLFFLLSVRSFLSLSCFLSFLSLSDWSLFSGFLSFFRFFFSFRRLSSSSSILDDDDELADLFDLWPMVYLEATCSKDESLSKVTGGINFGVNFKCSLKESVNGPRPIDVKKLMANRVCLGFSLGNRPSKNSCKVMSAKRSFSFKTPMFSFKSRRRFLRNTLDDDVVSSSFSFTQSKTPHEIESV